MAINLVTRFQPYTDEIFDKESQKALVTNNDFSWTGAHTVKVYKVTTATMNDYDRDAEGYGTNGSRYGAIQNLSATTEEMTLTQDRSFTFAIDKLDKDETGDQLEAASALARQQRQVIVPEVDSYTYGVMAAGAGTKPAAKILTENNIYDEITAGTEELDNELVPENNRFLIVTPAVYRLMKQNGEIIMATELSNEERVRGVIGNIDGMTVIKVPASRLPKGFGFMIAHPCATVAPTKLEEYKAHEDPPGISGSLCEGRICYDAFVLDNKAKAIYYQAVQLDGLTVASAAGTNSGKTAVTVTEAKAAASNIYKYAVADAVTPVSYGADVSSWTTWDGSAEITAASDTVITIVEATSAGKAVKSGYATVVAHA